MCTNEATVAYWLQPTNANARKRYLESGGGGADEAEGGEPLRVSQVTWGIT